MCKWVRLAYGSGILLTGITLQVLDILTMVGSERRTMFRELSETLKGGH